MLCLLSRFRKKIKSRKLCFKNARDVSSNIPNWNVLWIMKLYCGCFWGNAKTICSPWLFWKFTFKIQYMHSRFVNFNHIKMSYRPLHILVTKFEAYKRFRAMKCFANDRYTKKSHCWFFLNLLNLYRIMVSTFELFSLIVLDCSQDYEDSWVRILSWDECTRPIYRLSKHLVWIVSFLRYWKPASPSKLTIDEVCDICIEAHVYTLSYLCLTYCQTHF